MLSPVFLFPRFRAQNTFPSALIPRTDLRIRMKYSSPPPKESPSGKNYAVSVSNKPSLSGIIIKPPSLNLVSCFISTFFDPTAAADNLCRDSLRQAMIQRSLSFSQISVIDYGVNNSNELGKDY